MYGLFLLYCIEILGALLCGAQNLTVLPTAGLRNDTDQEDLTTTALTVLPNTSSVVMSTQSPTTVIRFPSSRSTKPPPGPQPTTPNGMFYSKECLPVFMVTGGLIIACAILLVSTLMLAWKVCQLSRHIKALSSNADLISNTEYWIGTAKMNKSKSETEPRETCVLMADLGQSQEETGNGATKEEGGTVNGDNKKEEGDAANSEEASSTPAENSSSSKPQEEATNSQPTKAVAAPTSEGTEEPKDVM